LDTTSKKAYPEVTLIAEDATTQGKL
jgi:hypothetical protein